MKVVDPKIFRLHAEFCKVLANPTRLMIIALLHQSELSVGGLAQAMDTAQTTTSQHLRVLRERGIVEARKEGQTVFYMLTDPRLMEACVIIRKVLLDKMKALGTTASELDPQGVTQTERELHGIASS